MLRTVLFLILSFSLLFSGCKISIDAAKDSAFRDDALHMRLQGLDRVFPSQYLDQYSTLSIAFKDLGAGSSSGDGVSFSCVFDRVVDGGVSSGSDCGQLPGTTNFSPSTGLFGWTPNALAIGPYEIRVDGRSRDEATTKIVVIDVRQLYTLTGLVADLDALFATFRAPAPNPVLVWRDLTASGFDGRILGVAGTPSSGWSGSGTAASQYALTFDGGTSRVDLGASVIPATRNTTMLSTWVAPANPDAAGAVIVGDGGGRDGGFVLRQSDVSSGKVELLVGNTAGSYSGVVLADVPTAYWRLGDTSGTTAVDSSGAANNGTYAGGYTLGAAGALGGDSNTAVTFNGTTGKVTTGAVTIGASATIEAWIKTTTSTIEVPIFSNRNAGGVAYFGLSGNKVFFYDQNALPLPWAVGVTSVIDGGWHHLVFTSDSVTTKLYLDGALESQSARARGASTGTGNIAWDSSNMFEYFQGSIDEVAVYGYALSSGQIKAHYDAGAGRFYPSNMLSWQPRAYWRLGEPGGSVAYDISTNGLNGTYSATGVTRAVAGALTGDSDTAVTFNGQSGMISGIGTTSSFNFMHQTGVYSVSFWAKLRDFTDNSVIARMVLGTAGWADGQGLLFAYETTVGAKWFYAIQMNSAANYIFPANSFADNNWHHVVFTADGANVRMYKDGVYQTAAALGALGAGNAPSAMTIGRSPTAAAAYFDGTLDEIAIFDYTLTPTQITKMYNSSGFSRCLSQTLFTNGAWSLLSALWDGTTASLYVNGHRECGVNPGTSIMNPSTSLVAGASASGSNAWSGSMNALRVYQTPSGAVPATNFLAEADRLRTTPVGDIVTAGLALLLDPANASGGMRAYSAGCSSSSSNFFDVTSLGGGTLTNFLSADCAGGVADGWRGSGVAADPYRLVFDGVDDYVDLPLPAGVPVGAAARSFEAWVKPSSATGGTILCSGTGQAAQQQFCLEAGTFLGLNYIFSDAVNGPNNLTVTAGQFVTVGSWNHLVITYDGALNWRYYKNGALQVGGAFPVAINTTAGGSVRVGQRTDAANGPYNGALGKAAIYNRALSAAEVSQNCKAWQSRFSGVTCQ